MTRPAPTYDLTLLLDPQAEEDTRTRIVGDTRATIAGGGELLRDDAWGERALSYPIERRATAEYHLFQFHAGTPQLLASLDHTLRITDGVLRFRIIKLKPGVPDAPEMVARRSEPQAPAETPPAAATPDAAEPVPAPAPAETPPAAATTPDAAEPAPAPAPAEAA
jgi:small subunit ribosomal protein S6